MLLDIEGTTCPVSFVADTLFPYARARLESFLMEHGHDPDLKPLLCDLQEAWHKNNSDANDNTFQSESVHLHEQESQHPPAMQPSLQQLCSFLKFLIDDDRKLTALKELQGLIWNEGYANGSLRAPLFADVAPVLERWHVAGLQLAVYSSGSVAAQQLLYGHSDAGDLRQLFCGWFDTRVGAKQDPASYLRIADSLGAPAGKILFISDSLSELNAAQLSGLHVIFSSRPGNPEDSPGPYSQITTLEQIPFPS
ncbi:MULTISPECIES: acireductone synthase [unclassified Synechococcus]|uniref:acireductone synthase n=1 Tax=unclassified Synechococcus TaxID=2626047 RepID=UPI0020CE92DB|nr:MULTISPECIES: acireductone synthase [unclassified Synechococcus]